MYHLKNIKAIVETRQKNSEIPQPTMAVASKPYSLVVFGLIFISSRV